ncbi:MAG: hypothetical protein K2I89_06340, partial [Muribaculaceae bacterium]|nr:hypothetical protein [Muribaculaceae bacterium]
IDMAGVKNYLAVNGTYGDYTNSIVYDGRNHVIKNFAPEYVADGGAQGYYNGSIFGVLTGKVMNLGVVDADVDMKGIDKTAGILGAYVGHGSVADKDNYATTYVENVYVTGKIKAGNYNTGGMFGTTGSAVEMKNCFAIVEYSGTGTRQGGIIGRVSNPMSIENCYVAGTVAGVGANVGLVAGEITSNGSLAADGVVAFNTGADNAVGTGTAEGAITIANTAADKAAGIEKVQKWAAFSKTETIDGYPALEYALSGEGTETSPYIIDSKEALCNAWKYVDGVNGGTYYFVQTADIDMAEVDLYDPIAGWNGAYKAIIHYDGKNHVIKNFAPTEPASLTEGDPATPYYSASIFGVPQGSIKNLGVVNATVTMKNQGAGILGAYGGHDNAGLTVENVFVEGTVSGAGNYTGGMFGTTGGKGTIELTNCFVNVDIESGKAAQTAGVVGRLRNELQLTNVYVAGTVCEGADLVAGTDKTPKVVVDAVIAFNTGAEAAFGTGINAEGTVKVATEETEAELIATVQKWEAFSADKLFAGYPVLKAFEALGEEAPEEPALKGSGTETDPYQIATKEDLCNAYTVVDGVNGGTYYFVQTADIDMAEVDLYDPIAGWNGAYKAIIHYDGKNHVIKNFAPTEPASLTEGDPATPYYSASIFGVPQGSIKNLGVVNATVTMKNQGAGILGAYGGHDNAGLTVENVFVEGTVSGAGNYTGGMFGTTGGKGTIELTNCFVNVDIESGKAAQTAGVVGRLRNALELTNVYVAGTVCEGATLVAGTDKTPKVVVDEVIAFNTGAEAAFGTGINAEGTVKVATEETKASLIAAVQKWTAFSATKVYKGYPILVDFEALGEDAPVGPSTGLFDAAVEAAPAVYYNLQGVQVANPENGVYIVRRGDKVTKEYIRK